MRVTERLTARHGGLLVVDMQEKLLSRIAERERIISYTLALIKGAGLLGVPVWATEQYPKGLGETVASIAELVPERQPKNSFHCCTVPQFLEQLYGRHIRHITVVGIEAHVCVAQTSLQLLDLGFRVQVPADAVGSRKAMDWEFAMRRLEHAGAVVSTAESALFEWTETSDRAEFKGISELIKSMGR